MRTLINTWDASAILSPSQDPSRARTEAAAFGPSLTILKGMAVARKTADNKIYPFVNGAADGTQNIVGFAKYSFVTDADGYIYYGTGINATPDVRSGPWMSSPIYRSGTFDPNDLSTAALVAQVTTFTPGGTIEVGDVFTITLTKPDLTTVAVSYAATATTAANVSAGLIAAWNANSDLATVATASGSATVVLTGVNAGVAFTVAGTTTEADGSAADAQTFTKANTTAASGISTANILAALPGSRLLANGHLLVP